MNNIILLYGGNSVEHEISIISALQIKKSYQGKYNLLLCYLKDSIFYYSDKLSDLEIYKNFTKEKKKISQIKFIANKNYFINKFKKIYFNAVWIVSHGNECEDGTLSSFFKTLNIDVIAENIYSATIGQDKILSKMCCNVLTLPYIKISKYDYLNHLNKIMKKVKELTYPLIIKPARLGSSIGINKVNNDLELKQKIEEILYLTDFIIVEKCLENFDEYNIAAILLNNELMLSEIEQVSKDKILTYNDKYKNENKSMVGQEKILPAIISTPLKNKIYDYAKKIYFNLNCQYIVRMDFLYDNINDKLYFNEINNIPGSLALYLFKAKNYDINDLINHYIDEGLKQNDLDKQLIKTYSNNIFNDLSINVNKFYK